MVDPALIAAQVRAQMESYTVEYASISRPDHLVGTILPAEQIERDLAAMRRALVEPYWLDAKIGASQLGQAEGVEPCVVVADDRNGHLLAYVPSQNQFTVLREFRLDTFGSFGLDGDAVGAFISI